MKNKVLIAGAGTLVLAGVLGTGIYAKADSNSNNGNRAPWYSQDRADALKKAIDNNDYDAWKSAMEDQMKARQDYLFSKVTSDNFEKYTEMMKDRRDGKFQEANKIAKDLGLPMGRAHFGRNMMFRHWGRGANCARNN